MKRLALAIVIIAMLPAAAAGANTWVAVPGSSDTSYDPPSLVRTPDGALHLVWTTSQFGVREVSISADGTVSSVSTVASGFATAGSPAIVNTPSGLITLFGGIQCTTATTCPEGLFGSASTDGGATWSTPLELLDADEVYASDVNATTLSDGTPLETWWHTLGTTVHLGLTSTTPDYDFQGAMNAGCCGYYSNLAADGSGNVQLAWDSNATGFVGTWSRPVNPSTGAPSGQPLLMPGSVTDYNGTQSQSHMAANTPIVAQSGVADQFYVAYPAGYPTTTDVLLWHVGSPSSSTVVSEPGDHDFVSLAADAQGGVWVFWTHAVGDAEHVYARRYASGAFEPTIDLGAPPGSSSIYSIYGSVAPNGDPEVVAVTGLAGSSSYFTIGPQVAPVPTPVLGSSVGGSVLSGTVYVELPHGAGASAALAKGQGFVPLTAPRALPVGTTVDARAGTLALVTATGKVGKTQTGVFAGGLFKISQAPRGLTKGLTTLSLVEGVFRGAPSYAECGTNAASIRSPAGLRAVAASASSKVLQTLHARDNHGKFGTRTRASAATVRGTVWTTVDKCGGTITKVSRGIVSVLNLHTRKVFNVHAGHSYYAKLYP